MNQPIDYSSSQDASESVTRFTTWLFLTAMLLGYSYVLFFSLHPYPLSYLLKISPLALLLVILFYHQTQSKNGHHTSGLLFNRLAGQRHYLVIYSLALLASASGDVFLDLDRSGYLKQALISFLVTQVLYCFLFYKLKSHPTRHSLLIPILIAACGYLIYQFSFSAGALFIPVVVYTLCLLLMACLGLLVPNGWIKLGALLFLCADAMIGINRFIISFDYSTQIIVSTYISAQLCIGWGMLFSED